MHTLTSAWRINNSGDCMSDATRGERSMLNRRQLLQLSTAAGLGAALPGVAEPAQRGRAAGAPAPGNCSTPRTAVANTQYGKVRGYVEDDVLAFKGVPYGASTGGENRWLPAKPPAPWDGRADLRSQLSTAPAHLDP
jgi:para-nitrobenzyl esterase